MDYVPIDDDGRKGWMCRPCQRYIETVFTKARNVMLTKEVKKHFLDLACRLSPENLHEDGEISGGDAELKYRRLMREWYALEQQVGREVDESEVWEWTEKGEIK
jgi:hypothetical protein